jgi:hypothetical protein
MKRNLFQPVALIGTVAVMITAAVALTLSRSTLFSSGLGSLKCYDPRSILRARCNRTYSNWNAGVTSDGLSCGLRSAILGAFVPTGTDALPSRENQ